MDFQLANITLTYQENCLDNADENEVCSHYLLEDNVGKEDAAEYALFSTEWGHSLPVGVEQTKDRHTTLYPCLTENWLHCSSLV